MLSNIDSFNKEYHKKYNNFIDDDKFNHNSLNAMYNNFDNENKFINDNST